jgi:glycosyltransferase involved in cell wall biosynthesis
VEQWKPYLEGQGISIDCYPFATDGMIDTLYQTGRFWEKAARLTAASVRRFADVVRTWRYDLVYVYRAAALLGPPIFEHLIDLIGKPVVFDFDDAIHILDTSESNRRWGWVKCPGKTATLCRMSAHVVAGNRHLARYASRYNRNVTVIPPSVDVDRYRPLPNLNGKDRLIVGWTGSSTSQAHLECFLPVLRELVNRHDIELRVHSDRPPRLGDVPCVWRPWSADTEAGEIAQFDVGIMPLPDDRWARGKCGMKILLCMAMGVPVIGSKVGANCDIIQHGVNGLLAESVSDWLEGAALLLRNPCLRVAMGKCGRETVEAKYSMTRCGHAFAGVVARTVGRASPPAHALSAPP